MSSSCQFAVDRLLSSVGWGEEQHPCSVWGGPLAWPFISLFCLEFKSVELQVCGRLRNQATEHRAYISPKAIH